MSKPESLTATSTAGDEVHILVLETDEPHPDTQREKGSFGSILHSLLNQAGTEHSPPLKVTTSMHYVVYDPANRAYGRVPHAHEIPPTTHAILLTGSVYDAHSNEPWVLQLLHLLDKLWRSRPDMLFSGVCFGHQILARLLGGDITPHPDGKWELSHTQLDLTPVGQQLFRTPSQQLALHQMHQDFVSCAPTPSSAAGLLSQDAKVHVWASTDHTEVQGLYVRDRLFTTQGHLGFSEDMVKRQIEIRQESGNLSDEQGEEAKEYAHLRHDGLVVAKALVRFFHGEDHDVD
jgi:GMP synthase-like glutamine amidotransferase